MRIAYRNLEIKRFITLALHKYNDELGIMDSFKMGSCMNEVIASDSTQQ